MRASTKEVATDMREAIYSALISSHYRVKVAGLLKNVPQEDLACAMLAGLGETIGLILSEACKNERERLVEFYPRLEDIITKTANRVWGGHMPDCGCSEE